MDPWSRAQLLQRLRINVTTPAQDPKAAEPTSRSSSISGCGEEGHFDVYAAHLAEDVPSENEFMEEAEGVEVSHDASRYSKEDEYGDRSDDNGEGESWVLPEIDGSDDVTAFLGKAILDDVKTAHVAVPGSARQSSSGKAKECCVCGVPAAYTCPGCQRRTCGITCVRVHKNDFDCTGERDVAAKVPLREFSDEQLQRDFHFLESCRRVVDNVERTFPKSVWRFNYRALPPPLHALREAARRRGVICQITSEGLRKREENTSRFDRKNNTIVWRCEFQFVVDAAQPGKLVSICTDWGSERHRLGDVLKYCWATNPPLLCYHINRQYNRASKYVGTATEKPAKALEEQEEKKETSTVASAETEDPTLCLTGKVAPSAMAEAVEGKDENHTDTKDAVALDAQTEGELVPLRAQEVVAAVPPIEPITEEEVQRRDFVRGFLNRGPYVILSKAERLGAEVKYFQLQPYETLNENLRLLFFVNEFPVFTVVHRDLLDKFPLVTDEDKETIRSSCRSKRTQEAPRERPPLRRRSDMSADELHRLAHVPCRRFLQSRCLLMEECPYWHCTPEEIPVCRAYLHFGQCDKGTRCSFRHDDAAVRAARKRPREELGGSSMSRGRGRGMGRGGRGMQGRGGFRGRQGPPRRM